MSGRNVVQNKHKAKVYLMFAQCSHSMSINIDASLMSCNLLFRDDYYRHFLGTYLHYHIKINECKLYEIVDAMAS